jgi:hypothetical protein
MAFHRSKNQEKTFKRSDFIKIQPKPAAELQLKYKGLVLHLPADFDEKTLMRFLKVLGELSC